MAFVVAGVWAAPSVAFAQEAAGSRPVVTMVALAAGTFGAHGGPLVLVGAIGFYLSDLSVAQGRFVKQSFANRAWGLPLYFFSQLVLAGTVSA